MNRLAATLLLLGVASSLAGCQSDTSVVVGAASSLSDLLAASVAEAPLEIELNLAGSQVLVSSIESGSPIDVLITADLESLSRLAVDARPFASNQLAIIVPDGNPLGIASVADLTSVRVVLADPTVPAGRYAADYLTGSGVAVDPLALELSARAVVLRVASGEADAGIAYLSDGAVAGVEAIVLPDALTTYWIAVVDPAGQLAADYLVSRLDLLTEFGLGSP